MQTCKFNTPLPTLATSMLLFILAKFYVPTGIYIDQFEKPCLRIKKYLCSFLGFVYMRKINKHNRKSAIWFGCYMNVVIKTF